MLRLAVTGGVAEGKSTVMGYLDELGYSTVSSDLVARQVLESDRVQQELRSVLGVEGEVSPEDLRSRVWSDEGLRREVNRIMHPEIVRRLQQEGGHATEVPLLIEACLQGLFARVWVVTCGPEEQMRRLVARLGSRERAEAVLASQLPSEMKVPFADVVVRTDRAPEDVKSFVAAAARRSLG